MKLVITFFLAVSAFAATAQIGDITSLSIPDNVKTGANLIKRNEDISFDVTDVDRARLSVHSVYTVLNKEGEDAFRWAQYTNRYRSLSDVEIKVFDAN